MTIRCVFAKAHSIRPCMHTSAEKMQLASLITANECSLTMRWGGGLNPCFRCMAGVCCLRAYANVTTSIAAGSNTLLLSRLQSCYRTQARLAHARRDPVHSRPVDDHMWTTIGYACVSDAHERKRFDCGSTTARGNDVPERIRKKRVPTKLPPFGCTWM